MHLLIESEQRLRTSLKIVSFYLKWYRDTLGNYAIYYLVGSLECLPDWVHLVSQRVGDVGGPTSAAFEMSEEELDWHLSLLAKHEGLCLLGWGSRWA
ncbi:hypothetical protein RQP46_002605 [Phenoliferia psychrophenolica]